MEKEVSTRLATLGHPQRLEVFRLLMRRYPDRLPAGEIARSLDLKASTLSAYLSALMKADLVQQERLGTSLRYFVAMEPVRETFDYLLFDTGRARADLLTPLRPFGGEIMTEGKFNVLFLCTGNSARSIFAEVLLRDFAGDRFAVYSAGTVPRSELNPYALDVLNDKGHKISGLRSKNFNEFIGDDAPQMDFVFTVCDQAANEQCPAWDGQPVSAHWGMPDPVKAKGTEAEKALAFQHAYGALKNRITSFAALPFETLDRLGLQKAVDAIGQQHSQ